MALLIDTAIPSGNGIIEAVDGDTVRLRPDLRTTPGHWFWWHIRVRGCAGRLVRIEMMVANALTIRGAVVSRDQGVTWDWIDNYDPAAQHVEVVAGGDDELRLALAMPYSRRDLDAWLGRHAGDPRLHATELCRSRAGASVPLLEIGRRDGGETRQALLTCRHHACESSASYALEGLLDAVLAGDALGRRLCDRWRLLVVPLVDYDGVEAGDQGKNRPPRDHNRDYAPPHLYPETQAISRLIADRCDSRLHLALDLHCPWVRGGQATGGTNQHIYIVGDADPGRAGRQADFAALLERSAVGPLPYRAAGTVAFGSAWNTSASFAAGTSCGMHLARVAPPACTVATLEIPYADAEGQVVTPASARAFGRDLARAMDALDS